MNVSAWSIKNPIAAVMLFVGLTFAGVVSFNAMKVQNFPDLDLPTITVSASLPGASPPQLESEVARKLENSIATTQGLKHITTRVQDGGVTITAEFRLEKPGQEALDDVRSAVAQVRSDLPTDLRDPVINKVNLAGSPVLAYTVAEPRAAALLNGKPVVGFEVARSKGAGEIEVGDAVRAALDELRAQHPDMQISEAFDFVTPVQEEYDGSMHLLYEGAALAVLVVWLFLRDARATFVSAVALPLSAIPAFIGMRYLDFSVNVITLLALSLVIGILVDDAIVEVENIVRHLRMGKSPYRAAMEAADEIGLAVIATTFTLIAVFLPTAFMAGIPGKFFKQFGWTASLAVAASLLVARVLTPMMAAYLLKPIVTHHDDPRWMRTYMRWARWCIAHRLITAMAAGAFFVASLMLIPLLPKGFIPPDDNSQTQVYLELAPGATLAQTKAAAEDARRRLMHVAHVRSIYTTIGGGAAGRRRHGLHGHDREGHHADPADRAQAGLETGFRRPVRQLFHRGGGGAGRAGRAVGGG